MRLFHLTKWTWTKNTFEKCRLTHLQCLRCLSSNYARQLFYVTAPRRDLINSLCKLVRAEETNAPAVRSNTLDDEAVSVRGDGLCGGVWAGAPADE